MPQIEHTKGRFSPLPAMTVALSTACAWDICLLLAVQDYKFLLAKPIFQGSPPESCILTSIAAESLLTLHLSRLEASKAEMLPRAFSAYM